MQTSSGRMGQGATRRRLRTLLALVLAFIAADVALCLLLEPYGGHTEIVWSDYRQAQDLDTIVVGTSVAAYGVDPRVLDQSLGSTSFNMGTPGQSMDNVLASIETATHDHNLDRVILCLGYSTMADVPYINSSIVFTQAKCLGETPPEAVADMTRLVSYGYYFDKLYSLSCIFPWAYDHVDYRLDRIATNVSNRLQGDIHAACKSVCDLSGETWRYEAQGFGGVHSTMSPNSYQGTAATYNKGVDFFEGNVESLRQICTYCHERQIALYVVGGTYTPTAIWEYGEDYWRQMNLVKTIVEEAGEHYFDLNMLHRDVYDPLLFSHSDNLHLSASGARQATEAISHLVQQTESGKDVSDLFFPYSKSGWKDYQASLDFVDSVDFTYVIDDNGNASITTEARTSSTTPVAYKYEAYDSGARRWVTKRDFTDAPTFTLEHADTSPVKVRITAKATNGRQDMDRTVQGDVYFE